MPVHWQNLQFCCRVEAERAADPRKNGVARGDFCQAQAQRNPDYSQAEGQHELMTRAK